MDNIKKNIYVFVHLNEKEQNKFIEEAREKGCFAESIKFMVRQGQEDHKTNKIYTNKGEEISLNDERLINGTRPYMTVSNANPDEVYNYYNWTFLESALQTGWKQQFCR